MRIRLLSTILLFGSLAVGCGKEEGGGGGGSASTVTGKPGLAAVGPKAATLEDDVAKLVPDDAVALIYVPSVERGVVKVRELVSSIDADAAAAISVAPLLEDAPPSVRENIDLTKPLAAAVSFPVGADEPVFTVIAATKDPAPIVAELEAQGMAKPMVSGKYVSVTIGPQPTARGGSALVKSIPAGDIGLRVDVARLVQRFRSEIDGMMAQAGEELQDVGGQAGTGAAMKPMLDAAKTFVDAAEWLDLALRIEGTRVDFDVEFRAKEGSVLAGKLEGSSDLVALAGRLPPDFPMVALMAIDSAGMMEWAGKLFETAAASMPAESRSALTEAMAMGKELEKYYGREQAFALRFGDQGVEGVTLRVSKDPKTAVAKTAEMTTRMASSMTGMGMNVEPLPTATLQGVEVTSVRMKFDFEKMLAAQGQDAPPEASQMIQPILGALFGPEGMVVRTAAVEGAVLSVYGPQSFAEQAISSAKSGGTPSGALADALARAGGKPSLLVHVEARALARQILTAVRKAMPPEKQADMPTVPDGRPATLLVHATGQGRVYRGGLSVEVAGWVDLVKSLMTLREPQSPLPEPVTVPPEGPTPPR